MTRQAHLSLRLARLPADQVQEQSGDGLVFLFAKGGAGKFTSTLASHRLGPGDMLVFNGAGNATLAVADPRGEFLFWTFSVDFEHLLPLFAADEISLLHHVTDRFKVGKVYRGGHPLAVECQRLLGGVPSAGTLDHRGQLVRIAAAILSAEFRDGLSQRHEAGGFDDHILRAFEKLTAFELVNLSAGELADHFRCSRRHLNRLFHRRFGASVAALRMEMRLLKAISLLRDAHAKVSHVAEQCGFHHLGLFNTCFKRRFGATPGQWRQSSCALAEGNPRKDPAMRACPMRQAGFCPLKTAPAAAAPASVASCPGKNVDGEGRLAGRRRHHLICGVRMPTNLSGTWPEFGGE